MKIAAFIGLTLISLAAAHSGCETEDHHGDLVFLGTVQKIEISPLENILDNHIVICRVDKVLSGDFSGEVFSFRVHSPSQSGLEVGKQYTIVATRTAEGFDVDQFQWMKY